MLLDRLRLSLAGSDAGSYTAARVRHLLGQCQPGHPVPAAQPANS